MTDYTKEAEELYPSEYRNSADVYNKADLADAKQEAHIAARQQSAAEIDRLRGEITRLQEEYDENGYDCPLPIKLQRIEQHFKMSIDSYKKMNDELRGEVERLTMDNMTHEFNQAEAEKFAPEYERQIREDEANKWRGEVERLSKFVETLFWEAKSDSGYNIANDLWQQFKTENNIQ